MDMSAGGRLRASPAPVVWMTGLPGAGKTTIAGALRDWLRGKGIRATVLDGDTMRGGLCSDLGFSDADRFENIRRLAHVAKLFQLEEYVVIVAAISPLKAHRALAREIVGQGFVEAFIATPVDVCRERDPKGMYRRAAQGQMSQFTGVSGAYEPPDAPDIMLDTSNRDLDATLADILSQLHGGVAPALPL